MTMASSYLSLLGITFKPGNDLSFGEPNHVLVFYYRHPPFYEVINSRLRYLEKSLQVFECKKLLCPHDFLCLPPYLKKFLKNLFLPAQWEGLPRNLFVKHWVGLPPFQ